MRIEYQNLPYGYLPRPYQVPFWRAMEGGCRRACLIRHRRGGKDIDAWNWLIKDAAMNVGTYWYIFPELQQGRKAIWDGFTNESRAFLDFIPKELIHNIRKDELKIQLKDPNNPTQGGSVIQIVSADRYSNLVGSNVRGCIFSEYAIQNPAAWIYILPILAANNGWAIFCYTPRGMNHGYELYMNALANKRWFVEKLTVDDTMKPVFDKQGNQKFDVNGLPIYEPVVTQAMIEEAIKEGMSEQEVKQEFYCSFEASLEGAYFADGMREAQADGRIRLISHDPKKLVHTAWDIGWDDHTSIWFFQLDGMDKKFIRFYENKHKSIAHYSDFLHERPNYRYGTHLGPHDVERHDVFYEGGKSRIDIAEEYGIQFTTVDRHFKPDQIEAGRKLLSTSHFDSNLAKQGVDCLKSYTKKFNYETQTYSNTPLRNWATHGADAFLVAAVGVDLIEDEDHTWNKQPKYANTDYERTPNRIRGPKKALTRSR